VPGTHDLRDHLFTTNGLPATNMAPLQVRVAGVLPTPHSGWLEEQAMSAPSLFGGYRATVIVVIVLWLAGFILLALVGRKRRPAQAAPVGARAPTFAERLRPLVERAAQGALSTDEQAALERLLIMHWQRRLGLAHADGAELITRLRQHDEAGALLRALEDWLHRPPGTATVHLDSILAPYRNLPDETVERDRIEPRSDAPVQTRADRS
jgi:hypothetical protein